MSRLVASARAPNIRSKSGGATCMGTTIRLYDWRVKRAPRRLPRRARPQPDEQLVELIERLGIPARRPGPDRLVGRLLRRIAIVDDQPRPAPVVLEGRGR